MFVGFGDQSKPESAICRSPEEETDLQGWTLRLQPPALGNPLGHRREVGLGAAREEAGGEGFFLSEVTSQVDLGDRAQEDLGSRVNTRIPADPVP